MADPHREKGNIDTPKVQGFSDDIGMLGSDQIERRINEEMLRQALVENNLDPTSMSYTGAIVHESEPLNTPSLRAVALDLDHDQGSNLQLRNGAASHEEIPSVQIPAHSGTNQVTTESCNILVNAPQTVLNGGANEIEMGFASFTKRQVIQLPQLSTTGTVTNPCIEIDCTSISRAENGRGNDQSSLSQSCEPKIEVEGLPSPSQVDQSQLKYHTLSQGPALQISTPKGISMTPEVLQSVIQQVKAQQQSAEQSHSSQNSSEGESGAQNNSVSFTLVSPSQQSTTAAPLGSSQNPIRIIQQGNRYMPMQQLTPDQLQQIMQVVQQQHANKAQDNGGTVIFNPHTNTKIMYRVIYPSELHKSQGSDQETYQVIRPLTLSQEQQTVTSLQKRPYRKRKETTPSSGTVINEEEDKEAGSGDTPELSKEEKEERKKHRPRTRSGRVSKPPKHMVKDYKHIHVLDWDEDYDDSDGGYSDLKHSDEESKARRNDQDEQETSDLFQALGDGKPKKYKCPSCEKSYIGQAGLERHYRLAPEHRRSEDENSNGQMQNGVLAEGEDSSKDASITQDGNSSRNSDPYLEEGKINGLDNFSEDSNTQDSINSTGTSSPVVRRGRGRGGYRGRWAHLKHNAHTRKKNKLREFTKLCSDEDLMEVLFPRLVGCISTWEFLLMKAEKGGSRPQVGVIYKEFEDLLRPLKQVCADYMKPVSEAELSNLQSHDQVIKVSDQNLASSLGLNVGTYKVEEMLPDDSNSFSSLHNKLSAASISSFSTTDQENDIFIEGNDSSQGRILWNGKRKFAAMSPSKVDNIPMKKPCFMNSVPARFPHEKSLKSLNNSEIKNESLSQQSISGILVSTPTTQNPSKSLASLSSTVLSSSQGSMSHQSLSYLISASSSKGCVVSSQGLKSSQLIPVVLNAASGAGTVTVSSSQILPVVLNSKNSKGMITNPTIVGTNKTAHHISSLPLVLAASGGQFQGNTIFMASRNPPKSQSVLLKESPNPKRTIQHQKQNILPTQQYNSPVSKPQISLLGSIHASNSNETAKIPASESSISQKFDLNTKPAEVKVSRKLFHEATASAHPSSMTNSSSVASSLLSSVKNEYLSGSVLVNSSHNVKVEYDTPSSSTSSLVPSSLTTVSAGLDRSHPQTLSFSSPSNVKMELGHEDLAFSSIEPSRGIEGSVVVSCPPLSATNLNRSATSGNDEDLDSSFDISAGVLSSIGFSGDELSSLNTSSDNPPTIPMSLPNIGVNQVSSVINEIIASSSVPNGGPLIQPKAANNGTSNHVSHTDLPFINESTPEYPTISPPSLKLKDSIILQPSSQSSFMSSSSDFIHLLAHKPSSPLMSSPCKDTVTSTSIHLSSMDNSLPSQILKSEGNPSAMMDLGALSFPDQGVEQLNGVSSALHTSDVDSILQDQITHTDETIDPLMELPQQLVNDDITMATPSGEEDGQFLLTEGSNIYQTEDGTWFIQSGDGNTYQLQGAQGLPMETVQALLGGDMINDTSADGVQAMN